MTKSIFEEIKQLAKHHNDELISVISSFQYGIGFTRKHYYRNLSLDDCEKLLTFYANISHGDFKSAFKSLNLLSNWYGIIPPKLEKLLCKWQKEYAPRLQY